MSFAKKITLGVAALVAVAGFVIIALVVFVNPNDYKPLIQQKAAEQGVELVIAGDISWSFFPRPGFSVSNIEARIPVDKAKQSIKLGELSLALQLSELLSGRIKVSHVSLRDASTAVGKEANAMVLLQAIAIDVNDVNVDGNPFPATMSMQVQQPDKPLINLKLVTTLTLANMQTAASINMEPLKLTIDDSTFEGQLHYTAGKPSHAVLKLNGNAFNLDRYLLADKSEAKAVDTKLAANIASSENVNAVESHKKEEPLPLAGLLAFPGEYQLAVEQLQVNHLQFSKAILSMVIAGEKVTLNELSATAYQGTVRLNGVLTAPAHGVPQLAINTKVTQVQLPALLNDLQQKPSSIAAGSLTLDSALTSRPLTNTQALASLSGQVQLAVDGLVINDLNIEQRVCESAAKVANKPMPDKAWSTTTVFKTLTTTAMIRDGIAQLSPVVGKLDTLDLTGHGPVNLLDNTLNLELDLALRNNATAANFCDVINPRLADIEWPLRCEGNYATQSGKDLCGIDKSRLDRVLGQVAEKKIEDKLKEKFGPDADKIKDGLKKLFR
jgi:uncharacterized protein involved in outer membrane biogenesis